MNTGQKPYLIGNKKWSHRVSTHGLVLLSSATLVKVSIMKNKNLEKFLHETVKLAIEAKTKLCSHEGGPVDSPPILLWQKHNGDVHVVGMNFPDESGALSAPNLLLKGLQQCFVQHGIPKQVAFVSEAYMKVLDNPSQADGIKRGDMKRSFEKEVDASISEIISVLVFNNKQTLHKIVVFKYSDKGVPVFEPYKPNGIDDEDSSDYKVGGAIADAVNEFRVLINVG